MSIRPEGQLCEGGIVRGGLWWHGTDYQCTGSAYAAGITVYCNDPSHKPKPIPGVTFEVSTDKQSDDPKEKT